MGVPDMDTTGAATMAVRDMDTTDAAPMAVPDMAVDIVGATREAATGAMLVADIAAMQEAGTTVVAASMAVADFTVVAASMAAADFTAAAATAATGKRVLRLDLSSRIFPVGSDLEVRPV
jgi:hypothetical protein